MVKARTGITRMADGRVLNRTGVMKVRVQRKRVVKDIRFLSNGYAEVYG
jgi:hypothetical protein